MNAVLRRIHSVNGLVVMPGAMASVEVRGECTAILRIRLTPRSADTLQIRVDLSELAKLETGPREGTAPLREPQSTLAL